MAPRKNSAPKTHFEQVPLEAIRHMRPDAPARGRRAPSLIVERQSAKREPHATPSRVPRRGVR